MMKHPFVGRLAGAALLIGAPLGIANAADMALKAPPPPPPPQFSWTGCYVGGNLGYGWGNSDGFNSTATTTFAGTAIPVVGPVYPGVNLNGIVYGAQIGCNYQINQWVVGVEGDWDGTVTHQGQGFTVNPGINPAAVGQTAEQWQSTIRGRLGWTGWNNRTLIYATGGVAVMQVDSNQFLGAPGVAFNNQSDTPWGWTVGGGVEYAVTDWFLVRAEYLYIRIPTYTTFTTGPFLGGPPSPLTNGITENVVRVGMSYKFW